MKFLPIAVIAVFSSTSLASAKGNKALDRSFAKADINDNLELDRTEFLALQSRGKSWTEAIHRFNLADADINGVLSLIEFRASNGGKEGRKPNRAQEFVLADLDENGSLDPEEFSLTMPQGKKWKKVLQEFGRKDKDNNSLLGPDELGIRGTKI